MTDKQLRAKELFDFLKKSKGVNQQEFAAMIKRTQPYVSKVISGKMANGNPVEFSDDVVDRLEHEINLNPLWYETGKGDMFKSAPEVQAETVPDSLGEPFIHNVGEPVLDYRNKFLQILPVVVDANNESRVLVVPEYALASYSEYYQDMNFVKKLPTEETPFDLKGKGTIAKFHVYGDSMEPNFHHGDFVYSSFVEINSYQDFQLKLRRGYVYVIVTFTRGIMLKRLYFHDGDEFVQCYSDNPDQKRFAPFALPISEIRQLWYFRRLYSAQAPRPYVPQDKLIDLERGLYETNKRVDSLSSDISNTRSGIEDIKKLLEKKNS